MACGGGQITAFTAFTALRPVGRKNCPSLECPDMSAAEALKAARAVGIHLEVDGEDLVLEAASEPPAVVLDELSRHKAEIAAVLRPGRDGWSAQGWQVSFDERAGIIEFDGGLSRAEAEAKAFDC